MVYAVLREDFYFDTLNFNDPILQGSPFLSDKLIDYVFHIFPNPPRNRGEMEPQMQVNLQTVAQVLKNVDLPYQTRLMEDLSTMATQNNLDATADLMYENHLRDLAQETQNTELIDRIERYKRLPLRAIAPEIIWGEGENTKKPSELSGSKYYVLVFWGSTCSHCLNELPKLQQDLKGIPDVKVLPIGLEDEPEN